MKGSTRRSLAGGLAGLALIVGVTYSLSRLIPQSAETIKKATTLRMMKITAYTSDGKVLREDTFDRNTTHFQITNGMTCYNKMNVYTLSLAGINPDTHCFPAATTIVEPLNAQYDPQKQ